MYSLKLALAVILCGGVTKTSKSGTEFLFDWNTFVAVVNNYLSSIIGTRIRGDPHLLLCGDPGTGKSQILRTAAKLAIRSIITTGVGTTAAGLTAAAMKVHFLHYLIYIFRSFFLELTFYKLRILMAGI